MVRMTKAKAIEALDAIDAAEPDGAHGDADEILLALVGPEVAAAYERVKERAPWWATS